jgi:alanine racemase
VHTGEQIDLLRRAVIPEHARFTVWLKLDTGMNRLGLNEAAFAAALDSLRSLACVRQPVKLMTHLASADEPQLQTTANQLARFAAATGSQPGERSVANSGCSISRTPAPIGYGRACSCMGSPRWRTGPAPTTACGP